MFAINFTSLGPAYHINSLAHCTMGLREKQERVP
jgi:hypothetical protein